MIFIRLLKQVLPFYYWIILGFILSFFTIASGIGLMVIAGYLISVCAIAIPLSQLQIAITGVRFFGTTRGVFRYLERIVSHNVTFKLLKQYRVWFYKKIEPLSPQRLIHFNSGDLLCRVVGDVENLENVYIRLILPPITLFAIIILLSVFFSFFNIYIAFLTAGSLFCSGYVLSAITYFISKKYGANIIELQAEISVMTLDMNQGYSDLVAFNKIESFQNKFSDLNLKLFAIKSKISFINALNISLINLIMNLTVLFAIILILPNLNSGLYNGVIVSVIILGIMASFEAVFPLPQVFQHLGAILKSAKRVYEIIDTKPIIDESELDIIPHPDRLDITFTKVNFKYSQKDRFNLCDVSLNIKQYDNIAIVGGSGSGKSSLINILMRFWDYKGSIKIGSCDLKAFRQSDITKYIAVCTQQVHMFSDSIKNNLKIADPGATDDEINNALKLAEALDFVNCLPDGINTVIGEFGSTLSGGEQRRLGIARTILSKAQILIFDEPNADLDFNTGCRIMSNLASLNNRTLIIITHIFTRQIEDFNNIVVMNNGKIIEQGRHHTLMSNHDSLYKKMLFMQQK